ncbi:hypothetical protein [Rhodococcus pyridinivorans]
MNFRIRVAAALAVAAALIAPAGVSAETLRTDGPSITVTIRNETDAPMVLSSSDNPYGAWTDAPAAVIAAGATETLAAGSNDRRGFGLQVGYTMPGDATVVLMANNYGTGNANVDGTHIGGANRHGFEVATIVKDGYPFMTADFAVTRP